MALSAGSVTVDDDGVRSGSGLALALYDAERGALYPVDLFDLTALNTTNVTHVDPLTGAAYQAVHDSTMTVSPAVVVDNATSTYWLFLSGENGGDFDDVTLVAPPLVTYTVATLDLGR